MKRDIAFAKLVYAEALKLGYYSILVDGSQSIAYNTKYVEKCFLIDENRGGK